MFHISKFTSMKLIYQTFVLLLFSPIAVAATIYGYVENVKVNDTFVLKAKLDTGAKSASINAQEIKLFEKEGEKRVSFTVIHHQEKKHFDLKLKRFVKIKVRTGEKNTGNFIRSIVRPVVVMNVNLGGKKKDIEVNLTDRHRFNYPFLLGRDAIIAFDGAINPALAFTQKINTAS